MAKTSNQKLKLLYIVKILNEMTDENHPVSTQKLIEELSKYDISAERKSIYNDIQQLIQFGYEIEKKKGKLNSGFYLSARTFELAELKLLVDAVQASKFITMKKSRELIMKLGSLTGRYEAKQLERQVYVSNRIKTINESIYYNVDIIHRAIQENVQITFKYYEWTVNKEMAVRKQGKVYHISPWALNFNDENYYLIGFDGENQKIKHYRVDKMKSIDLSELTREGMGIVEHLDIAEYCNKVFSMFGGEEEKVTLCFPTKMAGVVIDRFGKEVSIRKLDDQYFSIHVEVEISNQFFGWITGLGNEVTIISPSFVKEKYKNYLQKILENYANREEIKNEI